MNIEKQIREDHHAHLTVEVDADRLEGMKRRAASQLAKKVKIAGFRPGKAPYPVIVRQVGEAAILEEAIELLVDEIYPEVIKEAEIKPYGPGKLENISSADPITLEFSVPLEAETQLGDYHSIIKPYELTPVSDQDVVGVLQDLRDRHAIVEPVDRPAHVGDLVTLMLSAKSTDPENGSDEQLIQERSSTILIRPEAAEDAAEVNSEKPSESQVDEWPFPGFSQNLVGMAANEQKDLDYTYPENISNQALQGKSAQFKVQIEAIKSRQLPELDDEFAKTIGEYDTLDALQADVRKSLEAQAREAYNEQYDEETLKDAIEQTTFQYPVEMVDHEIETVISEFRRRLERQGMDFDLYLKSRNMDLDGFKEEARPIAEGRIKRALFLVEFGKAENIEVKPEELEKEAYSTMDYLYNTLPERDARKLSDRDVYTNIVGNVLADLMSRRSVERFREICSGGASKVTVEEPLEEESPADNGETEAVETIVDQLEPQQETSTTQDITTEGATESPSQVE